MANLQKIKEIAQARNMPLETLAKELGITPQALSKLIRGNSTKVSTLESIAQILKVSVAVFFDEEDSTKITYAEREGVAISGDANVIKKESERLISVIEKQSKQISQLLEQVARKDARIERLELEIQKLNNNPNK